MAALSFSDFEKLIAKLKSNTSLISTVNNIIYIILQFQVIFSHLVVVEHCSEKIMIMLKCSAILRLNNFPILL